MLCSLTNAGTPLLASSPLAACNNLLPTWPRQFSSLVVLPATCPQPRLRHWPEPFLPGRPSQHNQSRLITNPLPKFLSALIPILVAYFYQSRDQNLHFPIQSVTKSCLSPLLNIAGIQTFHSHSSGLCFSAEFLHTSVKYSPIHLMHLPLPNLVLPYFLPNISETPICPISPQFRSLLRESRPCRRRLLRKAIGFCDPDTLYLPRTTLCLPSTPNSPTRPNHTH